MVRKIIEKNRYIFMFFHFKGALLSQFFVYIVQICHIDVFSHNKQVLISVFFFKDRLSTNNDFLFFVAAILDLKMMSFLLTRIIYLLKLYNWV